MKIDIENTTNGQSAGKRLKDLISQDEASTTIPREGSTLYNYIMENPNTMINPISDKVKDDGEMIYGLVFKGSNHIYVGRSKNIKDRISKHRGKLLSNKHVNYHLQKAYNKYKVESLYYICLEKTNCPDRELFWIDYFNSYKRGFNRTRDTRNNTKGKPSVNRKPVIALNLEGEFVKEFETISEAAIFCNGERTNISACCKGKFNFVKGYIFVYKEDYDPNKKYTKKSNRSKRGTFTEEHRQNISKSLRGVRQTKERRDKVRLKQGQGVSVENTDLRFHSLNQAAQHFEVCSSTIKRAIENKRQVKGFKLNYCENIVQPSQKYEVSAYYWHREAFQEIISCFEGIADTLILVAHVKDSSIKKGGESTSVLDLRLTGTLREIMSSKQDASGVLIFDKKDPDKRFLDFRKSEENTFMKCRPEHLAGKIVEISNLKDGKFETSWENVFPDLKSKK